ncbi:SCO6880 family protein [Streptomyces sp. UG1]|uniref:SCO6880 family protein n=1 Tax=Streptomyces sp. UG1 TaxID=3417652 RepID=UPI003CE8A0CC
MVASAGRAATPHVTYLAVSLDLKADKRLISQAGRVAAGRVHRHGADHRLHRPGRRQRRTYGHRMADRPGHRRRDPHRLPPESPCRAPAVVRHRPRRADVAATGPVVQVEAYDRLCTDTARHTTHWVENWPRTEMGAGFLHQIMFTAGVRHSLALISVPQALDSALRDVQRTKAAIIADANDRAHRGQVSSEDDSVEYADVKQRERAHRRARRCSPDQPGHRHR